MSMIRADKKRGVDEDVWAKITRSLWYISKLFPFGWLGWSLGLRQGVTFNWLEEEKRLQNAIDTMFEKYGR